MSIEALLSEAYRCGVFLWIENGEVRHTSPAGEVPYSLLSLLRQNRQEIFSFLTKNAVFGESKIQRLPGNSRKAPLTTAQERLWYLAQLAPKSAAYNITAAIRLLGDLRIDVLQQSLQWVVDRHEVLRCAFPLCDGRPYQVARPRVSCIPRFTNLAHSFGGADKHFLSTWIVDESQHPFDLGHGPIFRLALARVAEREHVLVLTIHHIACDGWSLDVFYRELATCYEAFLVGQEPLLPVLTIQYLDFAFSERERVNRGIPREIADYWDNHLRDIPATLPLATDFSRLGNVDNRGAICPLLLPTELAQQLRALSSRTRATLFTVMLAAFVVLIHRYTEEDDVVVGTPIANREDTRTHPLIGLFVETIVLRTRVSSNVSWRVILDKVRQCILGAMAHKNMPFGEIVRKYRPQNMGRGVPFLQFMFVMQNTPREAFGFRDLKASLLPVDNESSMFDLTMYVREVEGTIRCCFEYDSSLFARETIERLAQSYLMALRGITEDLDQRILDVCILSETEKGRILGEWNQTESTYQNRACLNTLLEEHVARTPDAEAIVSGSQKSTYEELNRKANQLARHLQRTGVGAGSLVGVLMDRDIRTVTALLAILKSGGAYVPLDIEYPDDRLAYMLRDSGAKVLVTRKRHLAKVTGYNGTIICVDRDQALIARESQDNLNHPCSPDDLAYVMYTSGSTGMPKGVMTRHRSIINRLAWMWREFPFEDGEVSAQRTALSFVDSVWEIWGPLLQGRTVCILPTETIKDPKGLIQTLAEKRITRITFVPSLLRVFLQELSKEACAASKLPFRLVASSGEPLPYDLIQAWNASFPEVPLLNLYGSTEVTADATCFNTKGMIEPAFSVPIGRPIANTQIYILDQHNCPVPIGAYGELCIAGDGVADGYWKRPDLTNERFIRNPFGDDQYSRLYRTGDIARYRADGNLELRGRVDRQVKIRGFRVELGEVEAVVGQHPHIKQAAVTLREDEPGETSLVAYVVSDKIRSPWDLRKHVRSKLPEYMVPAHYVFIDAMPLTPNGKLDYKALPEADPGHIARSRHHIPPATKTEQTIAKIWQDILKLTEVGLHDNFFDIGGHSLAAIQAIDRIERALNVRVSPREFMLSNLGQIAAYCDGHGNIQEKTAILKG